MSALTLPGVSSWLVIAIYGEIKQTAFWGDGGWRRMEVDTVGEGSVCALPCLGARGCPEYLSEESELGIGML